MEDYVPFLTRRFYVALQFASELHYLDHRKGTTIPYVAHLMSVCALVLEAGGDEDQAIAALLHDAVEKHGGPSTLSTIRELFGTRVGDALEFRPDGPASDSEEKTDWRATKAKYLEHLRNANEDALFVAAADKLHNARAMLSDAREMGEKSWKRFNGPKEDQLWLYDEIVEILRHRDAPKMLVNELSKVVAELRKPTLSSEPGR
jgi:(p)ppGpp synthase/HD superfamily hydrolase